LKTLMITLSLMLSLPALAYEKSDFEKGFDAGKASCSATASASAWVCIAHQSFGYDGCIGVSTSGATKAAALLKISPTQIAIRQPGEACGDAPIVCREL